MRVSWLCALAPWVPLLTACGAAPAPIGSTVYPASDRARTAAPAAAPRSPPTSPMTSWLVRPSRSAGSATQMAKRSIKPAARRAVEVRRAVPGRGARLAQRSLRRARDRRGARAPRARFGPSARLGLRDVPGALWRPRCTPTASGHLDDAGLRKRTHYDERWGYPYAYYRPLLALGTRLRPAAEGTQRFA